MRRSIRALVMAAQVELPVDEHQRRVIGSVADVHHHLGDVDRPALGEYARLEDGAHLRIAPVRVGELQVVARHRFMDGEQPQHAAVVLAQVGLAALIAPVVRHWRDGEERVEAAVERAGRNEHRAAEGAQEARRPHDLQRLVGQANQVALGDERLDPLVLGTREARAARRPAGGLLRSRPAPAARSAPRRPASAHPAPRSATARGPAAASRPARFRTPMRPAAPARPASCRS